jgi:hypothetical protein
MRKILVTIAIVCATLQAQIVKVSITASAEQFALNPHSIGQSRHRVE